MRKLFAAALGSLILISTASAASSSNFPKRIISLSPSATEDLFSIGAGNQVVAVDDNSNFPTSAPKSKLSSFNPSAEAIAKYRPDFVVIQASATKSAAVVKQLRDLKIKVFIENTPTDLTGLYGELNALGVATGHTSNSAKLISEIKKARSNAILKAANKGATFFHELDNTLYSATSSTFIGKVYADFGLKNIADGAAKADDGGYPQLQNEYIIASNPNYIFLADGDFGETPSKISSRVGWSQIDAVKNKKIYLLPTDISSRWGPRIADFYKLVANALS